MTGFLIDLRLLAVSLTSDLPLVLAIIIALIAAKWLAAELAGRVFGFDATDRLLSTSLTLPQVAATLAAALVAYDAVNAAGERLIDGRMLNAMLVLVVVTAIIGPVLTERAVARRRNLPPGGDPLAGAEAPALCRADRSGSDNQSRTALNPSRPPVRAGNVAGPYPRRSRLTKRPDLTDKGTGADRWQGGD